MGVGAYTAGVSSYQNKSDGCGAISLGAAGGTVVNEVNPVAQASYHAARAQAPQPTRNHSKEGIQHGFLQAIKSCLNQYAMFSGRASRSEYWWFFLFQVLALIVTSMLGDTAYSIVALLLLLPALAVGARRLHDIGRSGWWQLLMLSGIGYLLLLYWWVQPSEA